MAYSTYSGVPYATNPAPAQLTMPDFSKTPTNAKTYSNVPFYLTVVETYLDCPVRPSA